MQGCGGFLSQQEAQGWFDYYFDDLGDVSELDTNGDGIPCHNAEDLFCCAWEVHSEGYTPTTDPHPAPITGSEYRDPSRPSMDTDLCRLADHRGLTRYVYEEPMVEGVDYTNRLTDADRNIAYLSPMFATGFPLDPNMNPSIGTLEVAFLAIDFPDSPGSETQLAKARTVAKEVTEYFRIASGGRLQTNFRFGDRVFRVPKDSGTFGLQGSGGLGRDLTVEVVEAADPYIDFTGVHSLFMLIPETNTQIANDWHVSPTPKNDGSNPFAVITEEGAIRAWVGNGYVFFRPDMIELGGLAMFYVHESLHDLGLVDLYLYGYQAADDLFDPGPTNVPMGEWAVMSAEHGHTRELIAWHRWLLGWLGDEQVYCRPSDSLTDVELSLSPLTREEEGYKAAMIPVSDRKVIVVESRRAEGYSASAGGMAIAVDVDGIRKRAYLRDFGADGLLVYTYDTSVIDGVGPARIQIPEGRPSEWDWVRCPITECTWASRGDLWTNWDPDNPDNVLLETQLDPLLRLGDSITVEGVTIELIEWGESDRVRISK
jgi:M6 family metalloprotease-like protein